MRSAELFGPEVAGLVQNRIDTVARDIHDLALLHEYQGRPVVVAVPGYDAAGLDRQLAELQFAILKVRRLLAEVDRAQRHVCDADRFVVDLFVRIGLDLVGGAFAGRRCRGRCDRSGESAGECEALPEHA